MIMTSELANKVVKVSVVVYCWRDCRTLRQTSGFDRGTPQGYKHNGLLGFHCNFYFAYYYYIIIIIIIPWSRVLIEKLTGAQLVKKFPTFYGPQKFITAFTEPATCPYPEPDEPSPYPPQSHTLKFHFDVILLSDVPGAKNFLGFRCTKGSVQVPGLVKCFLTW